MATYKETQSMSLQSPTSTIAPSISRIDSFTSNEQPAPSLEPPVHKHGNDTPDTLVENDTRYVYLTFDTSISFEDISSLDSAISPPNLKKYDSPLTWSNTRKNVIVALCCWCTFTAAYSAGSYSIASGPQRDKWGLSGVAFATGVTAWATGFAVSPMFLAPFSEINGRRPVFIGSAFAFLIGQIGCATTPTFGGMLACRFIVGAGAST
jgi:hypothetical protein